MVAPSIRTVASYYTHQEYSVRFLGHEFIVTVTPDSSVISRWIRDVLFNNRLSSQPLVVGVGVQWTPFTYYSDPPPGRYYSDSPADILQLCVGDQCIIIQLGYCDQVPNNLRSFLTDPETTFVGVKNSQDARKLARCSHQLEIGQLLDISRCLKDSRGRSMSRHSFESIMEECMGYRGLRLDREISMSDWSVYDLDHDQILQASLDAYVCSQLGVWARLWEV